MLFPLSQSGPPALSLTPEGAGYFPPPFPLKSGGRLSPGASVQSGLGDVKVKKFLIAVLNETLEPFRERRKYYEGRIEEVYEILRTGSEAARQMASQTLDDVKRAMKINYFDDKRLIAEQAEHFARKQ